MNDTETRNYQIKLITENTLNSQISNTKEEIKSVNNPAKHSQDKDNLNFMIEDASYVLSSRKKGEKLI